MKTQDMTEFHTGGGGSRNEDTILERPSFGHLARKLFKDTIFYRAFSKINAFPISCPYNGFTLAEVLITLGIIGIVAAMTLPALIQKQQRKETSVRLKKFYTAMSQAIMLSEIANGPVKYWPKEEIVYDKDGKYDKEANSNISDAFFNKYIAPYLKFTSSEIDKDYNNYTKVVFADGTVMHFRNGGCYDLFIDTNGEKKPNKSGRDFFVFVLCPQPFSKFMPNAHFKAYGQSNNREQLLNTCKTTPYQCSALLQYDNWEFKDDYPYKL